MHGEKGSGRAGEKGSGRAGGNNFDVLNDHRQFLA